MRARAIRFEDRADWADLLDAMHIARRQIFVDALGWEGLACVDGRERDAYDADRAVYIVVVNGAGDYRGSARLLPTGGPHMMADHFADWAEGGAPRGPDIWEWSRHAPGAIGLPPEENARARLALHLGITRFAEANGIAAFVAILEARLARAAEAVGWTPKPLGPERGYGAGAGAGRAVAILAACDAATRHRIAERVRRLAPDLLAPDMIDVSLAGPLATPSAPEVPRRFA